MKLLRFILLICSILILQIVDAQSISRSVSGSAGNTFTMNNHRVTWTVGETVTGIMTAGGHQLGNGFYQSLDMSVLLLKPEMESLTSIKVFPNPATENLTIRHKEQHSMTIRITTQDNRILKESEISSGDIISVEQWKQGFYFLNITDKVSKQETIFKIVIL